MVAKIVIPDVQTPHEGPRRSSLRQRGVTADGRMVDQELRGGQVILSKDPNPGAVKHEDWRPAEPEKPKERHSKGGTARSNLELNTLRMPGCVIRPCCLGVEGRRMIFITSSIDRTC